MVSINRRSFVSGAAVAGATLAYPAATMPRASSSNHAAMIEATRAAIRAGMDRDKIGAAAVCLIDGGQVAWTEGFGTTHADGLAVTPSTLFSIQSTTKNLTAVAVLIAVQEGLLDLDAPIARYLPDFTVHSRFDPVPRDRITLRHLLGHRAGFTHEAPVGNNYAPASPGFAAHVASIADTWLRFPVGERYRYSNLGYDLAAFILERRAEVTYAEWLSRKLFGRLGMRDSTADPAVYTRAANRAAGQHRGYDRVPLITPLVASGGVWTTARDIGAYLACHLAHGGPVLSPAMWDEMHGFAAGGDYSLGVMRSERRYGDTAVRVLHHRGGGFGFGCDFVYCPEAGIGWAALFNRPALAGYDFGTELLDRMLVAKFGARASRRPILSRSHIQPLPSRLRALTGNYVGRNLRAAIKTGEDGLRFASDKSGTSAPIQFQAPDELFVTAAEGETTTYRLYPATPAAPAHLECERGEESLDRNDGPDDPPGPDKPEWKRHVGRYRIDQWGRPAMNVVIERRNGWLYIDGIRLVTEWKRGLFFTSDGEAVDLRASPPTWRSLILERI